jgi:hypothetical protein
MDQAWQPTSLLRPGDDHDPLCGALWRVTCQQKNLITLYIKGVLDASLIWPRIPERPSAPCLKSLVSVKPFWQNLKSLVIIFDRRSPSGDWYLRAPTSGTGDDVNTSVTKKAESDIEMPPGYSSSEQEDHNASLRYMFVDELRYSGNDFARIFRLVPDEPVLVSLIESSTRACLQNPNLEIATLATDFWNIIEIDGESKSFYSDWGIYFAAPANQSRWYPILERLDYPEEDLTVPRLTFNTRDWQPDEDLRKLLRGIGGYGDRLDEKHLDLWEQTGR